MSILRDRVTKLIEACETMKLVLHRQCGITYIDLGHEDHERERRASLLPEADRAITLELLDNLCLATTYGVYERFVLIQQPDKTWKVISGDNGRQAHIFAAVLCRLMGLSLEEVTSGTAACTYYTFPEDYTDVQCNIPHNPLINALRRIGINLVISYHLDY